MNILKLPGCTLVLILLVMACKGPEFHQEVPYIRQTPDSNCYQACLLMMLNKFFPHEQLTLRQMDKLTGRKPNHWTFEAQLVPPLLERGLEVRLFATTEYDKISPDYVAQRYGRHVAPLIDYGSVRRASGFLTPDVYSKEELSWKQVEKYFRKGYLTMLCVEENALRTGKAGLFQGHGVMLVGISGDKAFIHDPRRGPKLEVSKENLIKAWQVKGTDRAVLFVRGKEIPMKENTQGSNKTMNPDANY